ncbi:hypothetical protein [Geodermatophilus maliterrae]|uniref:ATP synthase protein I n=1 Tax=Geodermatophilus maliterrae TaxID=3162531 RepID=A0ABV3X8B2_9ACTN
MTRLPQERPGWDLSFLRVGVLVTAAVAAVAALVVGLVGGWADAAGVLVGAAVVTSFFVVSGVVIAWAGRIDDTLTLPAALGTFFVKALVLFAVLNALPEDGWLDRLTMAWSVIVGALLWSGVQLRWVWTRPLYYVTPPAPPGQATAPPAPERPTTRG